ncbi:hypothetical protein CLV99_0978 [Sphingobacterium yanglingense]|uniref:Uncharacterized protein n=1 Tax=Sphingobacterium yanglingense TaxID=1437280 RepID=A0A4R6WS81_9SPHI|nr:hypothetical protein CLV99_0978 [Sphingobacterium yanglingense]
MISIKILLFIAVFFTIAYFENKQFQKNKNGSNNSKTKGDAE